ncbi:hypothetical protein H2201_001645 [Coniosporium apollinis]|uniref:Uncharacterized protein n=1 Tax=Coniosporium apollinis TaxID=61459 RepID=A0ABQ9P2M8_9PEZI|nr:hypothetical protein H2201_001645 [Coniosporium apollinis]
MPPIPIYKDAPINPSTTAAKAEGITPRTATTEDQQQQQPRPTPTITTATATDPTGPPPPQPGARPAAPTASSTAHNGPPPPQPGAVPKPPGHTPTVTATITETVTRQLPPTQMPAQYSIPPPPSNGAPTRSTAAAIPPPPTAAQQPTTLPLGPGVPPPPPSSAASTGAILQPSPFEPGQQHPQAEVGTAHGHRPRHSLEHPPNYAQNPYIDGSAAQRNALLDAAEAERRGRNSVGAWVGVVGEKLREAEEGVWRVVNGGK